MACDNIGSWSTDQVMSGILHVHVHVHTYCIAKLFLSSSDPSVNTVNTHSYPLIPLMIINKRHIHNHCYAGMQPCGAESWVPWRLKQETKSKTGFTVMFSGMSCQWLGLGVIIRDRLLVLLLADWVTDQSVELVVCRHAQLKTYRVIYCVPDTINSRTLPSKLRILVIDVIYW